MTNMLRTQPNERDIFSASLTASAQETEAALKRRRRDMDQAWDSVENGWKKLEKRMAEVGITRPSSSSEGMVRLNVGGSHINVHRSVLERKRGFASPAWTLGNLFEARWDARVPRDSDGRIVLDESPVCVKHLVHILFPGTHEIEAGLVAEEKPYLPYVAHALGLSTIGMSPTGMSVEGGSAILRPGEKGPLTAALQGWCPGKPAGLQLLYRASRDGWSTPSFREKCGDSRSTITLFQVGHGDGASIVGGFSSVSWAVHTISSQASFQNYPYYNNGQPSQPSQAILSASEASRDAFIFMLKNGAARYTFQPTRWTIRPGEKYASKAVSWDFDRTPCFGESDLFSPLSSRHGPLWISNNTYDIPAGSAILHLAGQAVSEIEVFRVCPKVSPVLQPKADFEVALPTPPQATKDPALPAQCNDDTRNFGVLIAGSLMEEKMALHQAEIELSRAKKATDVCATSFAAVFGPHVAAGKEDPVVELSVRGSRMTTLRSTLQVCADSALAVRFDDEKWPVTEKDLDEHGRRKMDCPPSVFSKVLDVLRMRKRSGWRRNGSKQSRNDKMRVAVKASDRTSFEEFVHMYFPGCENYVMDHVYFLKE